MGGVRVWGVVVLCKRWMNAAGYVGCVCLGCKRSGCLERIRKKGGGGFEISRGVEKKGYEGGRQREMGSGTK